MLSELNIVSESYVFVYHEPDISKKQGHRTKAQISGEFNPITKSADPHFNNRHGKEFKDERNINQYYMNMNIRGMEYLS